MFFLGLVNIYLHDEIQNIMLWTSQLLDSRPIEECRTVLGIKLLIFSQLL